MKVIKFNSGIEQPDDKGIVLKDIIETGANKIARMVGRKINPKTGKRDDYNTDIETVQRIEPRLDSKSGALTTVQKDNLVIETFVDRDKSYCIDANYSNGGNLEQYFNRSRRQLVFRKKSQTIPATIYKENAKSMLKRNKKGLLVNFDNIEWRKLTPLECERLQTFPDNYTEGVSNTQRYKALGNSFTVDVITHILKNIR